MRAISLILIILSSGLFIQCDESEKIEIGFEDEYFPLKGNSEWRYLREYYFTFDHALWRSDTVQNIIKGDTIFDGITYRKVVDGNGSIVKAIRKEGSKYYGRNHDQYLGFMKEYLFLDEEASLNTSWRHYKNDNTTLTEYRVTALNSSRTYNNIEYNSVMEIEVNYYFKKNDEFLLDYSTLHYYAKGIGEIYAYHPLPSSNFYGDLDISLLKFVP